MKKYEVEFRRTSYITYTVEAESEEEAQSIAWSDISDHEFKNADWEIESTEEIKNETDC